MISTEIIVTPARCALGGLRVSEAAQAKPRTARWMDSDQICATEASVDVVIAAVVGADQPKHVQVKATTRTTSMTSVPTGFPPSALERRT